MSEAVTVERTAVGGASPAELIRLSSRTLQVDVLDRGATLLDVRLGVDRHPATPSAREGSELSVEGERRYLGVTMGRYARIISGGTGLLDGRRIEVVRNAGRHHIHGGATGFDQHQWRAQTDTTEMAAWVELALKSDHGDQGYPGQLSCRVRFELDASRDRLTVAYGATTDRPTWCGLALHAFWNLGDGPAIDDQELSIDAGSVLEADGEFVPTGRVVPVDGTPFDLRTLAPLGDRVIDHCFVGPGTLRARLYSPATGWTLAVDTDQTCLAVYTGDHLAVPRSGLCMQPGPWPDAPNQPTFPSIELRPREHYRSLSTFTFTHQDTQP